MNDPWFEPAFFNAFGRDRWVGAMAGTVSDGARVLDIGAGSCRYRPLFAHCRYFAHDFAAYHGSESGILAEGSWEYGELDYVSEITAIPVEDGSFDIALCTEVLEHVPDPAAALREIGRILAPGGRAFITAPLMSALHQEPYHYYGGFTPHFYLRFLAESGLELESIESNGGFFRQLAQEVYRGAGIVRASGRYGRRHPVSLALRAVMGKRIGRWLCALDDEFPIGEFTVGYHVVARKLANANATRLALI